MSTDTTTHAATGRSWLQEPLDTWQPYHGLIPGKVIAERVLLICCCLCEWLLGSSGIWWLNWFLRKRQNLDVCAIMCWINVNMHKLVTQHPCDHEACCRPCIHAELGCAAAITYFSLYCIECLLQLCCCVHPGVTDASVLEHRWGTDITALGPPFHFIVACGKQPACA